MSLKDFGQNIISALRYQFDRRANNSIFLVDAVMSTLISIFVLFGSIWLYRQLALIYWSVFIKKYWDQRHIVYFIILAAGSMLANLINFGIYYIIDKYKLFEEYKITKSGFIWDNDKQKWEILKRKAIKLNVINIVFIGLTGTFLDTLFLNDSLVSPQIPSMPTILSQMFFCIMVEGVLFYTFHKIGHLYLYDLHKIHHQFHVPSPLATSCSHPIDYVLGALIPFAVGPKILSGKMHITTLFYLIMYRISEGHDGHSNYQFPWSPLRVLPFSTTSQYHSFHHTHNEGNFGSLDVLPDTALLDNSAFHKFKESKRKQKAKDKDKEIYSVEEKKKKN